MNNRLNDTATKKVEEREEEREQKEENPVISYSSIVNVDKLNVKRKIGIISFISFALCYIYYSSTPLRLNCVCLLRVELEFIV